MTPPFSKDTYRKNAAIYKLMGNPKRLAILNYLKRGEVAAGELVKVMKLPKANVSQNLSNLKWAHLVRARRVGKNVYYRLVDPAIVDLCDLLNKLRKRKIIH
ncbi:MAG: metalloregulator ArsR/SmtB family transcription factor [bacterium]|nr:metalloregulator ArsR/SmtB family transcription factor [bacterium]